MSTVRPAPRSASASNASSAASSVSRPTNVSGLEPREVRVQNFVDLPRVHLEPGDDDHLLLAVDDEEVAVLVHADDVAGVEPTVAQDSCRFLRLAPVPVHEIRPPQTQL